MRRNGHSSMTPRQYLEHVRQRDLARAARNEAYRRRIKETPCAAASGRSEAPLPR